MSAIKQSPGPRAVQPNVGDARGEAIAALLAMIEKAEAILRETTTMDHDGDQLPDDDPDAKALLDAIATLRAAVARAESRS